MSSPENAKCLPCFMLIAAVLYYDDTVSIFICASFYNGKYMPNVNITIRVYGSRNKHGKETFHAFSAWKLFNNIFLMPRQHFIFWPTQLSFLLSTLSYITHWEKHMIKSGCGLLYFPCFKYKEHQVSF